MKTIVWDIDDVLNDLMRDWFEQEWRPCHRHCAVIYSDLRENPPDAILGISRTEYLQSLDAFRRTGFESLNPVPEALSWFERHGARCRHIALTSVPLHAAHLSASWVLRHFGRWIRSVNIVPSHREGDGAVEYDKTKKEFLDWWGKADIFVDDSEINVTAASELGVAAIAMPRPWNSACSSIAETFERLGQMIAPS